MDCNTSLAQAKLDRVQREDARGFFNTYKALLFAHRDNLTIFQQDSCRMVTNIHRLEGTIIDTQNVRICTHVCLCVFYRVLPSGLWSPGSRQCKAGSARHGAKTLA